VLVINRRYVNYFYLWDVAASGVKFDFKKEWHGNTEEKGMAVWPPTRALAAQGKSKLLHNRPYN
jgi:hypothetical protein